MSVVYNGGLFKSINIFYAYFNVFFFVRLLIYTRLMLTSPAFLLKSTGQHFRRSFKFKPMLHKVFVYGTLKRDEPNHYWLTKPENGLGNFIAEGTTKNKYPLIIATRYNIPFLLYSPGNGHNVKGEVYEVDDTMLSKLDILEDHPNYYIREIDYIEIIKAGKKEVEKCWVYFLKNFKPELLHRPTMECYSSSGSHGLPYMESNNESTVDDLDDVIKK
ncbi:putative gamma-glutamylcyclotransferase CG2811 isoform X2 [Plodia interpunctella]|uniref:putative gamma-glutamylcyclotransferase CG2811 isoform X2 n=1 Tax=Plodia interpunctella TaxID=58824 RepID=UPI002368C59A|nr:putative gamma-glutamylcyclotransferase CG2811 isoform X2 [Plodia interpunctella]